MFKKYPITALAGFAICFCCCVMLWAAAHYEFGFYFDRAHSRGSRIYRINSYEQFIKQKASDALIVAVA